MNDSLTSHIRKHLGDEAGLFTFLDELPLGIAILDTHGRIVAVNRTYETITGADRQRILGLQCLHALRCDYCMLGCPVEAGKSGFSPLSKDANILNRDRKKIPVRLTISPIGVNGHAPIGYLESIQNLQQSQEMTDRDIHAYNFAGIVGNSPQIQKIFNMIPSVADTDSSVLITGETGTGKDLLAEAIHKASDRSRGPFIKVNCGALPDTLLESELFGHVKGAFTGADRNKPGRFRLAHGGTLFLTEIGDLPLQLQVKLLSFLDDKVIYPLGSGNGFNADVRVIVATHRNLDEMVQQKRFRQDLLFRLNVIRFQLPPLRERGEDVALIRDHFLNEYCDRFKKRITGFSKGAAKILNGYPHPGNVRELRNIVEYAVNFCTSETIQVQQLPAYLTENAGLWMGAAQPTEPTLLPGQPPAPVGFPTEVGDGGWDDTERRMILEALVRSGGRKGKAAELLGWGRSTMWRKMKRHGIT